MRKLAFIIMSLGLAGSVQAAGTSSAQFLKLGAGAKAAALGEAAVSVTDDVTAAYWNPAGLSKVESTELALMQNSYLVDTNYQYAGLALPTRNYTFAFSFYRMDYGSIDSYNASNVKQGSFNAGSMAGSISLAKKLSDSASMGMSLKYISESIENESGTAFAADFGGIMKVSRFSIGASIQNLGSSIKFVKESEDLPLTIRLGASTQFFNEKLTGAFDISKARDNEATFHTGLDYKLLSIVSLRAGYQVTPGNSLNIDGITNISGGMGISLKNFNIDYAVSPFGDLGMAHRISLKYKFAARE
ncbi:MAG: PorV/PorQ family protein [Elusimicrobiota bacterium]